MTALGRHVRFRSVRSPFAVAGVFALLLCGCQSDAASICGKLATCHLLPTGNGFDESVCEGEVTGELSEHDRGACADCVDAHACTDIVTQCRPQCAPKVTCVDPDRCPDGGDSAQ